MDSKTVTSYIAQLQKLSSTLSLGEIIILQKEVVELLQKEKLSDQAYLVSKIKFRPEPETASADVYHLQMRSIAIKNGVSEFINILRDILNDKNEKTNNCRFWWSFGIAIVSIVLTLIFGIYSLK